MPAFIWHGAIQFQDLAGKFRFRSFNPISAIYLICELKDLLSSLHRILKKESWGTSGPVSSGRRLQGPEGGP